MKGGTLFSGIGAPELAAPWIDWRWCAEIEPFAAAVHRARFKGTPNLGDVTKIDPGSVEPVDIIVFGSPCQSFSVAGKRRGLDDPRGDLALVALRLVEQLRPRWILWENVPGVLSNDDGRDFGTILGAVGQCGYGFAYRILDAQFAGVPQRRRRLFLVGHLGDWRAAAAVLFEPASLHGHPAPSREAREGAPAKSLCSTDGGIDREDRHTLIGYGGNNQAGPIDVATACNAHGGPHGRLDFESETFVVADPVSANEARTYTHEGRNNFRLRNVVQIQNATRGKSQNGLGVSDDDISYTLDGASQHAVAFKASHYTRDKDGAPSELVPPLSADADKGDQDLLIAFESRFARNGRGAPEPVVPPLKAQSGETGKGDSAPLLANAMSVRRLTPRECERLQGLPDDFTLIDYRGKPAVDGPRYRALGNSMAVPVVRWILERIGAADD